MGQLDSVVKLDLSSSSRNGWPGGGQDYSNSTESLLLDRRIYPHGPNPFNSLRSPKAVSGRVGTWKVVTYIPKPVILKTERILCKDGKWRTIRRPLRITKHVLVFPKTGRKRNTRKQKRSKLFVTAKPLYRGTHKVLSNSVSAATGIHPAGEGWQRTIMGHLASNNAPGWTTSGDDIQLASLLDTWQYSTEADAEASAKFLDKVKDQSASLAQIVAERKQTVGTVADVFSRLARSLIAIKHGNVQKAASILLPKDRKSLSNDWLAYQYGIKPLISDINGMSQHIAKTFNKFPVRRVVSKSAIKFDTRILSREFNNANGRGTIITTEEVEGVVKYSASIKVTSAGAAQISQLGFANPLALIWEVIPYSFIVDWVSPIGAYLNRIDAGLGTEVSNAYKTVFIKKKVTVTIEYHGTDINGYAWSGGGSVTKVEKVECWRTMLSSLPPNPSPPFKSPISTTHFLNALALFTQLRR